MTPLTQQLEQQIGEDASPAEGDAFAQSPNSTDLAPAAAGDAQVESPSELPAEEVEPPAEGDAVQPVSK